MLQTRTDFSGKGVVCGDSFYSFDFRAGLMLAAPSSPNPLAFDVMKNDFLS
jgi:hypothetical protein